MFISILWEKKVVAGATQSPLLQCLSFTLCLALSVDNVNVLRVRSPLRIRLLPDSQPATGSLLTRDNSLARNLQLISCSMLGAWAPSPFPEVPHGGGHSQVSTPGTYLLRRKGLCYFPEPTCEISSCRFAPYSLMLQLFCNIQNLCQSYIELCVVTSALDTVRAGFNWHTILFNIFQKKNPYLLLSKFFRHYINTFLYSNIFENFQIYYCRDQTVFRGYKS